MGARVKAGLRAIGDALAEQIRNVTEQIEGIDVQVERGYLLNPTPPSVDIYWDEPARDPDTAAFDDISGAYLFTVRARVGTADTDAGQDLLWAFADDTDDLCLAAAILDEPTLGGLAGSIDVRGFTGIRAFEQVSGEGWYLGFQFAVLVIPAES